MEFKIWYILLGLLLTTLALFESVLRRLPLSMSMVYLAVGVSLGPVGFGLIRLDAVNSAHLLERASEVAVIISLFAAGLKLGTPLRDPRWWLPVRLAFVSMAITVGLVALVGVYLLGLPLGAAVLLGACIAPTDPVLASDVQVENPWDRDQLRFSLTGEAGLNDGTAFPFVMLGLGLLGTHELGAFGWRWFAVDVVWAIAGGFAVGAILGALIGKVAVFLRRKHRQALGLDDFLSLGLLASAYGIALYIHTYGFLAAFAAGLALRRVETAAEPEALPEEMPVVHGPEEDQQKNVDPKHVPAVMAHAVLQFNEQLERLCELALVLLVGGLLTRSYLPGQAIWFIPLLLLIIRPIAVLIGLWRSGLKPMERAFICWFGIRGIGSVYYLMYGITHGLPRDAAHLMTGLTLTLILVSVIAHGISVTPLMEFYQRLRPRRGNPISGESVHNPDA